MLEIKVVWTTKKQCYETFLFVRLIWLDLGHLMFIKESFFKVKIFQRKDFSESFLIFRQIVIPHFVSIFRHDYAVAGCPISMIYNFHLPTTTQNKISISSSSLLRVHVKNPHVFPSKRKLWKDFTPTKVFNLMPFHLKLFFEKCKLNVWKMFKQFFVPSRKLPQFLMYA